MKKVEEFPSFGDASNRAKSLARENRIFAAVVPIEDQKFQVVYEIPETQSRSNSVVAGDSGRCPAEAPSKRVEDSIMAALRDRSLTTTQIRSYLLLLPEYNFMPEEVAELRQAHQSSAHGIVPRLCRVCGGTGGVERSCSACGGSGAAKL
jgi:hypothetical protein